jgi:hypothetical protein
VCLKDKNIWLSLNQIARLFDRDKSVISRYLRNVFEKNELSKNSVVVKIATTVSGGKNYQVDFYKLLTKGQFCDRIYIIFKIKNRRKI